MIMAKQNRFYKYHLIESEPFSGESIVTEKIHGSNFAIGYIENSLRLQTRTKIVEKNFNQFGLQEIIEPLTQIVEKIKSILDYNFLIYGEIFGKTFPMMNYYDSESVAVFGSKEVFFRAFDLYNVDKNTYVKYSDAIQIFKKVELPCVPILNINYKTIDDLYIIVEKHQSQFSEKFVEGFVLKKDENQLSKSRDIFKLVREEFRVKKVPLLNKNKIKSYINYNRFFSAYSKFGDYPEEIKKEMIRDSLKDMTSVICDEVKKEVEENFLGFQKKLTKQKLKSGS